MTGDSARYQRERIVDSIPVLSLTAFAPAVGALLIFLVPGFQKRNSAADRADRVARLASCCRSSWSIDFDKNAEFQYDGASFLADRASASSTTWESTASRCC